MGSTPAASTNYLFNFNELKIATQNCGYITPTSADLFLFSKNSTSHPAPVFPLSSKSLFPI